MKPLRSLLLVFALALCAAPPATAMNPMRHEVTAVTAKAPMSPAPDLKLFSLTAVAGLAAMGATRKMNLSQSYIFGGETFGPGNDIEVPEDFPQIDGEGNVVHPPGSTAARNIATSNRVNNTIPTTSGGVTETGGSPSVGPGTGRTVSGKTGEELEAMPKADLVDLAESLGITVTRADGSDGTPLKEDYVAALGATATT